MVIPVIDLTGKQVGWIDHTKLEATGIYKHDGKLWAYSSNATLQEIDIIAIEPSDIVPMTEELDEP